MTKIDEKIEQMIQHYEKAYENMGVLVYRNGEVIDGDTPSIWTNQAKLYVEYWEDEIEDFEYFLEDILDIKFQEVATMIVTVIYFTNNRTLLINNLQ